MKDYTLLEKETNCFFPQSGAWNRNCFKKSQEYKMANLPCHLRDNIWLANMMKKERGLTDISNDKIIEYIENSDYFKEKRDKYEQKIIRWQINWMISGGDGWLVDSQYGSEFIAFNPSCDVGFRKGIVDTLLEIGLDEETIEKGIEENALLWREKYMMQAFKNQYEPVWYRLSDNKEENLPPANPSHKENWLKIRKYEYYQIHKDSVDKYGYVDSDMKMSKKEALEIYDFLKIENKKRLEEISQFRKSYSGNSIRLKGVMKTDLTKPKDKPKSLLKRINEYKNHLKH